jgi:hypothetical protein
MVTIPVMGLVAMHQHDAPWVTEGLLPQSENIRKQPTPEQ